MESRPIPIRRRDPEVTRALLAASPLPAELVDELVADLPGRSGPAVTCSLCGHPGTVDEPLPPSGVCFDCQDKDGVL